MVHRRFSNLGIWIVLAALAAPLPAHADLITVDSNETLLASMDLAAAGDTILVLCGVYQAEGMALPGGVTIRSETGEPDCAVFQSAGGAPILTCEGTTSEVRIEGITFTTIPEGMVIPVSRGAGLLIKESSPSVTNCVFQDLRANYGGAVYCGDGAAPVFSKCSFIRNSARGAGGSVNCVGNSAPLFALCLFADASDGFLNVALGSRPRIIACTLVGGLAMICWDDAIINVRKTIIAGGVWFGDPSSVPEFDCTNLYTGGVDPWSGILSDQAGINGNISADPLFCGDAGGGQPYTLDATSPCADTATLGCGLIGAFPVACSLSGVGDDHTSMPVLKTGLTGNYPNPFNPRTTIRYNLAAPGHVKIAVYDLAGRLIRELVSSSLQAGTHETHWDGKASNGRACAAGVYFVQLKTDTTQDTDRLSLIK